MVDPAILLEQLHHGLTSQDATGRRIVTAARICFTEYGFQATTMERIATEAEVGVATVYRRFGHKKELVRLAIIDEALRITRLVGHVAEKAATPADGIVEVFAAFVHEASAPKLMTRSIRESSSAGELAAFLTDENAIAITRTFVADRLTRWQDAGQLAADLDPDILGEMIGRLMMSLVTTPASVIPIHDVDKARDFARTYLVPLLRTTEARSGL